MPKSTIGFDTVRKIRLALPGVETSTAYGSPALKVRGKLLACVPTHRSAEPGSLAVRVDFDDRAELLAAAPDVYYVTDHYLNYNAVLVRLSRVTPDVLRDLLGMAHKFVTARRHARNLLADLVTELINKPYEIGDSTVSGSAFQFAKSVVQCDQVEDRCFTLCFSHIGWHPSSANSLPWDLVLC